MTKATDDVSLTISRLVRSPRLRAYLRNVRDWHGYIRFLGLPDRRDNPDVLIDRLFVEPLITRRYVSPDETPSRWIDDAETIFDVLRTNKALLILGDPGSGKSTLLNYLVWLLARPTVSIWRERMGRWLLPVPMLLRDLHLHGVRSIGNLMDAFLQHSMSEPLRESGYLETVLDQGRALILLDGIDEIGDATAREDLRRAVFEGLFRYPGCRWLISSRIVGYDEVPFDRAPDSREMREVQTRPGASPDESTKTLFGLEDERRLTQRNLLDGFDTRRYGEGPLVTRYIAPFDDRRIEAFARNWYVQREAAATRAGEDAAHLVRAVHADNAILRLARVPNLLTMMALIHRVEATLPHGRALLYDRIAEAYLESIDKFRGVYSGAYNLPQKRRWLARVGYEMQRRRSTDVDNRDRVTGEELLAESHEVITWLDDEMKHSSVADDMSAEEFLDFVGRRSGLFLPRGKDRYAFVHLSFQEYFAAVAIEREVTGVRWARNTPTPLGLERSTLAEWAGQSVWREPFAFLFELLVSKEEWHADLLIAIFGEGFSRLENEEAAIAVKLAELTARLVANPRSGLPRDTVPSAIVAAVRPALRHQSTAAYPKQPASVLANLLGDDSDWNKRTLAVVGEQLKTLNTHTLSLAQTQVTDLRPISGFTGLEVLDLSRTRVSDLTPISGLTALGILHLDQTQVSDLTPLENLGDLRYLALDQTPTADLGPVSHLRALRSLSVTDTGVVDLRPLRNLTRLKSLFLSRTGVSDLGALATLAKLTFLYVWRTRVSDLAPLENLTALETLDLWHTPVSDLGPVAKLRALKSLDVGRTGVVDLKPLADLRALKALNIHGTRVEDLAPLASLTGLRSLDLERTKVSDLGPLAGLGNLTSLDLTQTRVADLGPVRQLTALESLDLSRTRVRDVGALQGLTALKVLNLSRTRVSDLRPLTRLGTLERLVLEETKVSRDMVKDVENALPKCDIAY